METFAEYILKEEDYIQKMIIAYYLSKKTGIFFDKSIVLKAEIAKLFMDYCSIDVDQNLIETAILLCNCRKIDNAQKFGKLETYAKEGAEYLRTLGFSKRFCKICEELNRFSGSYPREKESDILEIVDQFTGLILNRVERPAFQPIDALMILKERNFKVIHNRYLNEFEIFVNAMEKIYIRDVVDVPILKKLVLIHNLEANVKSFITILGNKYSQKIEKAINNSIKIPAKESINLGKAKNKKYIRIKYQPNRALFSKEIATRILNHESLYKIEE